MDFLRSMKLSTISRYLKYDRQIISCCENNANIERSTRLCHDHFHKQNAETNKHRQNVVFSRTQRRFATTRHKSVSNFPSQETALDKKEWMKSTEIRFRIWGDWWSVAMGMEKQQKVRKNETKVFNLTKRPVAFHKTRGRLI